MDKKPLDLQVGQAADYEGLKVTVTKIGSAKNYDGKKCFAIYVSYQNGTKDSASYNEFDWKYEDGNGARHSDTAMPEGKESMSSGDLAPGGKYEGVIYFANKGAMKKVVYMPSMFSDEEQKATWAVK